MSNNAKTTVTSVKFHSLPIGERFRWQDTQYVKISPLIAREETSGKSQLIQRAAQVEPLDGQVVARTAKAANAGRSALEEYHRAVLSCLDSLAQTTPHKTLAQIRQRLDEALHHARNRLDTTKG